MNAGQTCVAPDYVLVDESRKQQFLTEMKTAFSHLYGKEIKKNPDFGRIVNERHMERLQKILEQDAKYLFCGGGADTLQRYIEPAILDLGKDQNAASMQEELFGPILPVLSYHKLEDAVRFVNKRAKHLRCICLRKKDLQKSSFGTGVLGGVCVNDTISHLINPDLPFGGVGASGMGQYHGKYSFDTFTHEKSVFYKPADWNLPVCYSPIYKREDESGEILSQIAGKCLDFDTASTCILNPAGGRKDGIQYSGSGRNDRSEYTYTALFMMKKCQDVQSF